MSFKVESTSNFEKEAMRLIKKYPSLKNEISELIDAVALNPYLGESLGNHVYKIRISIASKGKGKRGGARVITQIKVIKETVYLISIYSKGDKNNITDAEIRELIKATS